MTISDWVDEKKAAGVDVSQIELPKNMAYDEDPVVYFVPRTIPLQRSNFLDTGITAEARTRKLASIHQR